jgi:hypothetical protein
MDTVRIEYMLLGVSGNVIQDWMITQGSIENNAQVYVPRAMSVKNNQSRMHIARVRVVNEQTNRIVDLFS